MQASDVPDKISLAFADGGTKNVIPLDEQTGADIGRASFTTGFPVINSTDPAAGGIPPQRNDFNGILYQLSNLLRWQNSGGTFTFDQALSDDIGGYPKGSMLLKADGSGYWRSTIDDNVNDPDVDGTGWAELTPQSTATVSGLIKIATQALVNAGNDDSTAITPAKLAAWADQASGFLRATNNLGDVSSASSARGNLGLGGAATREVGIAAGNLMEVGAFGLGFDTDSPASYYSGDVHELKNGGLYSAYPSTGATNCPPGQAGEVYNILSMPGRNGYLGLLAVSVRREARAYFKARVEGGWSDWIELGKKSVFDASETGTSVRSDGLVEKWGRVSVPGSGDITGSVTFPEAFPNGCFNVQLTLISSFGTDSRSVYIDPDNLPGATGFGYEGDTINPGSEFYYRAIGY